jgi:hypothetical protein
MLECDAMRNILMRLRSMLKQQCWQAEHQQKQTPR